MESSTNNIYLLQPNTDKDIKQGSNQLVSYASCSMKGWRVDNEDVEISALGVKNGVSVFGVFDGHGGSYVAKFIEQIFLDTLKQQLSVPQIKYDQALINTFLKTDELINSKQGYLFMSKYCYMESRQKQQGTNLDFEQFIKNEQEEPYFQQMLERYDDIGQNICNNVGSTGVVVLINFNKELFIANAGDSRAIICIKGKAKSLTKDHNTKNIQEVDRITKAGGTITGGRLDGGSGINLTRSFGDFRYKQNTTIASNKQQVIVDPDIVYHKITADDDFILIGCDGCWEVMSDQEICEFIKSRIKKGINLDDILEELFDYQISQSDLEGDICCDNMTAILITINQANSMLSSQTMIQGENIKVQKRKSNVSVQVKNSNMTSSVIKAVKTNSRQKTKKYIPDTTKIFQSNENKMI